MSFEIEVLLVSFAISIILGIITIPILRKLKVGQIERDDGPASHLKKQGTPTMAMEFNMTLMSPPVGFFMSTGISSPDAVRRCCWFSTERAPTATYI